MPTPAEQFEAARAAGRATGEHALAVIRQAVGKTINLQRVQAPVARFCPQCGRVWPFGTLPYERIASAGRCITCESNHTVSPVRGPHYEHDGPAAA